MSSDAFSNRSPADPTDALSIQDRADVSDGPSSQGRPDPGHALSIHDRADAGDAPSSQHQADPADASSSQVRDELRAAFSGRSPAELSDTIGQLHALGGAVLGVLFEAIAAYDATEAWRQDGAGSLGLWISYALGVTTTTGAEYARVAKALGALPVVSAALGTGHLCYEQVRALTRVATASDEAGLVEQAQTMTATQVEAMVRALREVSSEEAAQANNSRSLRLRWSVQERMLRVSGRFPEVDGAVITSVIESIAERATSPEAPEKEPWDARCADALVELCSCAVGGDVTGGTHVPAGTDGDEGEVGDAAAVTGEAAATRPEADEGGTRIEGSSEQGDTGPGSVMDHQAEAVTADDQTHQILGRNDRTERVEGDIDPDASPAAVNHTVGPAEAEDAPAPVEAESGNGAATTTTSKQTVRMLAEPVRAEIVVHVETGVLASGGSGAAALECGAPVASETVRRLACDGWIQAVVEGAGRPLGVGRRRRTVPRSLLHVLRHRDGGCRFPGCTRTRWVQAHHRVHWADGGRTDVDNLVLLCAAHHRFVHEGGWRVEGDPGGELRFVHPDGRELEVGPPGLRAEVAERFGVGFEAGARVGDWLALWADPGTDGSGTRGEETSSPTADSSLMAEAPPTSEEGGRSP